LGETYINREEEKEKVEVDADRMKGSVFPKRILLRRGEKGVPDYS